MPALDTVSITSDTASDFPTRKTFAVTVVGGDA